MVLDDQIFISTRQKDTPTQNKHRYPILQTTGILGDFTPKKIQPAGTYLYKENWDKRWQPFASHRIIYHFQALLIPHAL